MPILPEAQIEACRGAGKEIILAEKKGGGTVRINKGFWEGLWKSDQLLNGNASSLNPSRKEKETQSVSFRILFPCDLVLIRHIGKGKKKTILALKTLEYLRKAGASRRQRESGKGESAFRTPRSFELVLAGKELKQQAKEKKGKRPRKRLITEEEEKKTRIRIPREKRGTLRKLSG